MSGKGPKGPKDNTQILLEVFFMSHKDYDVRDFVPSDFTQCFKMYS